MYDTTHDLLISNVRLTNYKDINEYIANVKYSQKRLVIITKSGGYFEDAYFSKHRSTYRSTHYLASYSITLPKLG